MREHRRAQRAGYTIAFMLCALISPGLNACQPQQSARPNQTATTSTTPQATPQTVTVNPPSQELKTYEGTGVVTKVVLENPYDKTLASVELNHEEIVGLMPPMIMEFYVKEKSVLKGIKVGDKVNFTVEAKGGMEIISKIKKQ